MFYNNTILAIVGGRKNSKGLPNKNILDFHGKPMVTWSIESAKNSLSVDRTIVSTDSEEIINIAKNLGADTPFIRPEEYARDDSQVYGAIRHCIHWLEENENKTYDFVLWLQPTSPLRTSQHIDKAFEYYFKNRKTKNDALVSVVKAPLESGLLMCVKQNKYIEFCFDSKKRNAQRQNIPTYYLPNGALYIAPTHVIKKYTFYTKRTLFFEMNYDVSCDINTMEDYHKALNIPFNGT